MNWFNIVKKEIKVDVLEKKIKEMMMVDDYGSSWLTKAVLPKLNTPEVMAKINDSPLLYSKNTLRVTKDDFFELFDTTYGQDLRSITNHVLDSFDKEELVEIFDGSTFRMWGRLDQDSSQSHEQEDKLKEVIIKYVVSECKERVVKEFQPKKYSLIFSVSLPKDAANKEEAIKKYNAYRDELNMSWDIPELKEGSTLEEYKKALGEMDAYLIGAADDFKGYHDGGFGWYHILKEIEGFRTLEGLWK